MQRTIVIARTADWLTFRTYAKQLLLANMGPETVQWVDGDAVCQDLFQQSDRQIDKSALLKESTSLASATASTRTFTFPRRFLELCQVACCHESSDRFTLLYRLLWRMSQNPSLCHNPLDVDVMLVRTLVRTVLRAQHHMQGFVRFRKLTTIEKELVHVAWYEPEHYIVQATAPFFTQRFASSRWSILTPKGCAHWLPCSETLPQGRLHFGPPADPGQKPPADSGEMLWQTYYASTFNPARIKRQTMQKFMPRKYWNNLPEAQWIEPLCQRAATMLSKQGKPRA